MSCEVLTDGHPGVVLNATFSALQSQIRPVHAGQAFRVCERSPDPDQNVEYVGASPSFEPRYAV